MEGESSVPFVFQRTDESITGLLGSHEHDDFNSSVVDLPEQFIQTVSLLTVIDEFNVLSDVLIQGEVLTADLDLHWGVEANFVTELFDFNRPSG